MAAVYPSALKSFTNPTTSNTLNSPSHAQQHIDANDEITAMQTELGLVPKGTYATVRARLDAMTLIAVGTKVAKTYGTPYQALTDGYVTATAMGQGEPSYGTIIGYSDAAATPTTFIAGDSFYRNLGFSGHSPYGNISFFVKKNDYYLVSMVETSGSNTITVWFTPLG